MRRALSSRSVSLGALVALSSAVLTGCASPEPSPTIEYAAPYDDSAEDEPVDDAEEEPADDAGETLEEDDEDDFEEDFEEDEVVATCVERDSEDDDSYEVVDDENCDGVSKHGAYLWYYGGTTTNGSRMSGGTTARPRDVSVVTGGGDELTRSGKISTNGFGNRTSTGS
ncbi:hypothetical protein GCM10010412_033270 [Nonomuraea recticatena]|uniref:Uncharacterized protein n=1 Tax=Nonomuraea recticatena TaxID=46178 RepID=A0ABN3RTU3_9ACTN